MSFLQGIIRGHMEVVLLVHGLALVLLGLTILLHPKEASARRLARMIGLLAGFGLLQGAAEWLKLWGRANGGGSLFEALAILYGAVAFGLLFEFGRRLLRAGRRVSHRRTWRIRVSSSWVYSPVVLGLVLAVLGSPDFRSGLELGSRYLLALPGAVVTGIGLLLYRRRERLIGAGRASVQFYMAAVAFVAYGVLSAVAVPRVAVFPAATVNEASFLALTGTSVELFLAACAVMLLFAVSAILREFSGEVRDRLRAALQESETSLDEVRRLSGRNRLILEAAGQGICGMDLEGRTTFVNSVAAELLGWSPDELIGKSLHDVVRHSRPDGQPYAQDECPIEAAIREGRSHHTDKEIFWNKDKTGFPVEYAVTPVREDDALAGAVISFKDITERKEAEKHLQESALIIESTPQGVITTDTKGIIQSVNPAFLANAGYRREEVIGRTPRFLRSGHHPRSFYDALWDELEQRGQWQGEIWNRRKSGEVYPEWLSVNALRDSEGHVTHYIGIYSDISTHHEVQQRLHHLAYYDGLTSLPNRELFSDRLGLALAQARRERHAVAVMFLDLDRFKNINDSLGHSVGDRLLKAVANRLRRTIREGDTIARIGGDEFTVILPALDVPQNAGRVARKILNAFVRPFKLEGREFYITGSIGISVYPHDGEDLETLTRQADTAMYRAKELGRNNYQFYRPDMSARFQKRLVLENDLRRALENCELYLVYQPQVDIRDGHVVGVEALARWDHPVLGEVSPSTFIPIAEETGLICQVGVWGLRTACREAVQWVEAGGEQFRVAVNLSAQQLRQGGLAQTVADILAETGLDPRSLALELTESVLMENSAANVSTLEEVVEMGVQIHLDDFGTGYSSLSYIKRFSIDKLKIDQSFVRDIPGDADGRALTAMIIAMAHATNIRVAAEGVERQEQLDFLREQGCDEMQGFLFSKPVPAKDIAPMFRDPVKIAG